MEADAINLSIRNHEETVATIWEFSERACELYRFFDLFNRRFFEGKLPTPVISFRTGRVSSLGWYRVGRNEVGVKDQINLNSKHLERPKYQTLTTLLHEMIHEWQDYFGKHSKGYYHNKQFRLKTKELGIPSDSRGHTIDITDPFVGFCKKHGVDFAQLDDFRKQGGYSKVKRPRGRSKLHKYTCGCTNIWAAIKVIASCKQCGGDFALC